MLESDATFHVAVTAQLLLIVGFFKRVYQTDTHLCIGTRYIFATWPDETLVTTFTLKRTGGHQVVTILNKIRNYHETYYLN